MNLEHCRGISWNRIFQHVPNAKVVVLKRGNIIKTAVSGFYGSLLNQNDCGSNMSRMKQLQSRCSSMMKQLVPWDEMLFVQQISIWRNRIDVFEHSLWNELPQVERVTIYYEDLQLNIHNAIRQLLETIGAVPDASTTVDITTNPQQQQRDSRLVKRTPDDLSKLLIHYDAIASSLLKDSKCLCLYKQLISNSTIVLNESACTVTITYNNSEMKCAGR